MIENHLGNKIRMMRSLQNIPQKYMANELGITQAAYSNIEKKEEGISTERMLKIAEIMGVTVEDIEKIEDRFTVNINNQTGGNGFVNNNYISPNTEELLLRMTESLAETTKALAALVATLKKD